MEGCSSDDDDDGDDGGACVAYRNGPMMSSTGRSKDRSRAGSRVRSMVGSMD
jgi:hypothetical protein